MRAYFWPIILILKLFISNFKILKDIAIYLGYFSPGDPKNLVRTINVTNEHLNTCKRHIKNTEIKTFLEIGPGGSNFSFIPAIEHCCSKAILIDIIPLKYDILKRIDINQHLSEERIEFIRKYRKTGEYSYEDCGIFSYDSKIEFDVVISHSVIQHIHREMIGDFFRKLNKITKFNGIHSHHIDFKDCFSGGMNQLRFSHKFWSKDCIKNSGFYTNRHRLSFYLGSIQEYGFEVMDCKISRHERPFINNYWVHSDIASEVIGDDLSISNAVLTFRKVKSL